MIVVTGGAGFLGSNLVKALNARGRADILVVDDLTDGGKFANLADCEIEDYTDKDHFLELVVSGHEFEQQPEAVFHQGACTDTTEDDGRYMMKNNYAYSKALLGYCLEREIPFLYASSAAVYGTGSIFREERQFESPLNVYGYSKFLFDQYARRVLPTTRSQLVGLRYFNVYGPREAHKGAMASVAFHLYKQLKREDTVRLFEGSHGYADGEQRRDFVHVDDAVAVNLWFWEHPHCSGIFNVGTGRSQSFNELARAVLDWHGRGRIEYIPFPARLRSRYQSHTEADVTSLREAGYEAEFLSLQEGVPSYMRWLEDNID